MYELQSTLLHEAAIEVTIKLMVMVPANCSALRIVKQSTVAKVVPNTCDPKTTGRGRGNAPMDETTAKAIAQIEGSSMLHCFSGRAG